MDDEVDLLARTCWGEARGEPQPEGMEAVASVILNRVKARRWANNIRGVVTAPFQFSCWNRRDPNRAKMLAVTPERDAQFRQALEIARRAVAGTLADRTHKSDHYHSRSISPLWARGQTPRARIGRHVFYKLG